jgi:hypothetical protein
MNFQSVALKVGYFVSCKSRQKVVCIPKPNGTLWRVPLVKVGFKEVHEVLRDFLEEEQWASRGELAGRFGCVRVRRTM